MDNTRCAGRQEKTIISRRARGLVACAECRRMKLKCDKKLPCGSCGIEDFPIIMNGIAYAKHDYLPLTPTFASSPTGKLASRQESRTLGTSGLQARDENARLRERIAQLEDALAFTHSQISKEIHPLLVEPLIRPPEDNADDYKNNKMVEDSAAGDDSEEVKFSRPSAKDETLCQTVNALDVPPPSQSLSSQEVLDSTLERLSTQIPLGSPFNLESFIPSILKDLPEKIRAWSLCEIFYATYTIYSIPVQQEELNQVYLSPVYKYLEDSRLNQHLPLPSTTFRPHRCAIIFFIFAIGAWMDVTNQHYWREADRYFQIGLSCLSMQSLFNSPEVASVQALFLLASFNEVRGVASTAALSPSWTILSLACKIAQGLGLHRDNPHWKLDPITIQRRRWLYWELVSLEIFHSLRTGRPPSSRQVYVDARFPEDTGRIDADGQPLQGFSRWKQAAGQGCYSDVVETLPAVTPTQYDVIIELDYKVRAKEIPPHLNRVVIDAEGHENNLTLLEFMQLWVLGVARCMVLLAIHRTHFSKALQDPSRNPLKSPYAPSFIASYRAASWLVKIHHTAQRRFPDLLPRLWHPWTNVMSAAMVLGSIVIDAPSFFVGKCPLEELRIASSIFEEAAARTVSPRTKSGAKIVQNILTKAEEADAQRSAGDGAAQSHISILPTDYGDDELAIFGGQTRLVPVKSLQMLLQSPPGAFSFTSNPSSSCLESMQDVHPSLIKFLTTAPMTPVASTCTFEDFANTRFGPLPSLEPQLHNHEIALPQLGSWINSSLPNTHGSWNVGDTFASNTFENYLTAPAGAPEGIGSESSNTTPWQDFMRQYSFTN